MRPISPRLLDGSRHGRLFQRRCLSRLVILLAAILLSGSVLPQAAHADDYYLPADGKLYAFTGTDYGGSSCSDVGNRSSWNTTCYNKSMSVKNRGYPGAYAAVNLYWGWNYNGAYACIGQATGWNNLYYKYFTWGTGYGLNDRLARNVASHYWVNGCPA